MVRSIAVSGVLLAVLGVPASGAAEPNSEDAAKGAEASLFERLDVDGDGLLRAEGSGGDQSALERRLLERLLRTGDANGDGALDREEFNTAMEPGRAERPLTEKRGGRLSGADALALMVVRMDANGDGSIEQSEVPTPYRRPFTRMLEAADLDRDGVLTQRERTQRAPAMARLAERVSFFLGVDVEVELASLTDEQRRRFEKVQKPPRRGQNLANAKRAEEYFNRLDGNADGFIEADEVPQQLAARFDQMLTRADRNDDGKLALGEMKRFANLLAELEKARPSDEAVERALQGLLKRDADGDGRLSPEEMPNMSDRRFQRADADGDGFLDQTELERVAAFVASRLSGAREAMRAGAPAMEAETSGPPDPGR